MNIARYRHSFEVVVIQSEGLESDILQKKLTSLRYGCRVLPWADLPAIYNQPPHILVAYWERDHVDVERVLNELHETLPETHIILLSPLHDLAEAYELFHDLAYDCLPWPLACEEQLVMAVDRAAERDYFMYRCEQNGVEFDPTPTAEPPTQLQEAAADLNLFLDHLHKAQSLEEVVDHSLSRLLKLMPNARLAFFKYFSNRRSLVLSGTRGFDHLNLKGVGVNLNELESNFKVQDLRDPKKIGAFCEMAERVFEAPEFQSELIEGTDGPLGLLVFFGMTQPLQSFPEVQLLFRQVREHLRLIDFERRLHVVTSRDDATEVFHRQSFMESLHQEIARARRIQLPVSLILLKVDQVPSVLREMGREEGDLLLKMVAKIFRKHSRVNDIVGRTGSDEFGLLLPHTHNQGAAIKAERLRRIIESADFSRLLKSVGQVTISCGVSEYPSLCRDADELLASSDAALFEVVKANMNRVCLASAPHGFVADFVVNEPEWLLGGRRSGS